MLSLAKFNSGSLFLTCSYVILVYLLHAVLCILHIGINSVARQSVRNGQLASQSETFKCSALDQEQNKKIIANIEDLDFRII